MSEIVATIENPSITVLVSPAIIDVQCNDPQAIDVTVNDPAIHVQIVEEVVEISQGINGARGPKGDPGDGTAYAWRKDQRIATEGQILITLDATPVANTEQVFLNGIYQGVTVDYTISGSEITFLNALSDLDKIEVAYAVIA